MLSRSRETKYYLCLNNQVEGGDEDNLPLTRRVQSELWQHQHPKNCEDSNLRFLLADWETDIGFGMGAQIASMTGILAIAVNEQRILVSNYFNRADHQECLGILLTVACLQVIVYMLFLASIYVKCRWISEDIYNVV